MSDLSLQLQQAASQLPVSSYFDDALFRREMDGFSTIFHQASLGTVGVSTLQSRAFAGQIADTFVFCLPGSTGACRDGWDLVLGLELDSRYRTCSLAGQIPRLRDVCA